MEKQKNGHGENEFYAERNYKDTIFRLLFKDRKRLLGLYNAMNGTVYDNPDDLEIATLENAIYMSMKNDVGFIIDSGLHLYEHQSTINPNMPLRFLHYVSKEYEKMIDSSELYREKQVMIPAPRFVVFYNGTDEYPERNVLRLSDAYHNKTEPWQLELTVEVLNINDGYNEEIKAQCKDLKEYMQYVNYVRDGRKNMTLRDAVAIAVDKCIKQGILKEFLLSNKAEVVAMSIFEYDEEGVRELLRRDAYEDGMERGIRDGMAQGMAQGIAQGRLETLITLVQQGLLSIADAAKQADMSVDEFESKINDIHTEAKGEGK